VLAVALVILVVEGFFVYRWYDRYYGYDAASDYSASSGDPKAVEGTIPETTQDAGDADSAQVSTFTHTATDENSRGDYTYLGHPDINGDPNAVILVTVSQDQRSAEGDAYDHNIGVWYDSAGQKRWAIFNQDRAAVPAGAGFEVVVPPASESFVHRAELSNIVGNTTYLDNPLTNNEPDVALSVTQNWNPGGGAGIYNDHSVGVLYDDDVQKWALYNKDGLPMPDGAAFNVSVSEGAEGAR
jgi:hypothetical protein